MHAVNERARLDRRQHQPFFSLYSLGLIGQRRQARRAEDELVYTDHYEWPVVMLAVGIVCLSAMDAAFTLRLINGGAVELNAVMAVLIETNVTRFVAFKLGLTALSVLLLILHKNVKLRFGFKVYRVAQATFVMYLLLMAWEFYLFTLIPH